MYVKKALAGKLLITTSLLIFVPVVLITGYVREFALNEGYSKIELEDVS